MMGIHDRFMLSHWSNFRTSPRHRGAGVILVALFVALGFLPAASSAQVDPVHPLVGHWMVSANDELPGEPTRTGIYTFMADGTILVVFQSRMNGTGTAEIISSGTGTWEPEGTRAARYSVSWSLYDSHGVIDRIVTVDGLLTIGDGDEMFVDDRLASLVSVRNGRGLLTAMFGGDSGEMTAEITGRAIRVGTA